MKLISIKHPSVNARNSNVSPTLIALPERVVLPLVSPWGEASPVVRKGEQVKVGQCIARGDNILVPQVLASVSGEVVEIKAWPSHMGNDVASVVIATQGQEPSSPASRQAELEDPQAIFQRILAAGIREVDPHPWPLALRLASPELIAGVLPSPATPLTQPIETLIINCLDRQPGVFLRRELLVQRETEVLEVMPLLQKVSAAVRSVLVVAEDQNLSGDFTEKLSGAGVELLRCPNKYPLGLAPLMAQFVTKKEVPQPANDTRLINSTVLDLNAALQVLASVRNGAPASELSVQVDAPYAGLAQIAQVPTGTLLEDLLPHLPQLPAKPAKVIIGGLFLGRAQFSFQIPITHEIDAITFQSAAELNRSSNDPCFNCGYCVQYCPMQLLPNELGKYCEFGKFDDAERNFLLNCIECGVCGYVCPAKRPMMQLLRFGKQELAAMRETS
jgi:Na+-translocating ferredoxin:NAD+ oxidoreductase subunit C